MVELAALFVAQRGDPKWVILIKPVGEVDKSSEILFCGDGVNVQGDLWIFPNPFGLILKEHNTLYQEFSVFFQPQDLLPVVRHELPQLIPECFGMIPNLSVYQFV